MPISSNSFFFQIEEKYNPFERDLAVINIFYGTATAMGKQVGAELC